MFSSNSVLPAPENSSDATKLNMNSKVLRTTKWNSIMETGNPEQPEHASLPIPLGDAPATCSVSRQLVLRTQAVVPCHGYVGVRF